MCIRDSSNGTDTRYFANTVKRDKNSFDFTMNLSLIHISPRAPYVVLGPPAVFIIDPVSGELIKSLFTKSEVDNYGKPLAGIIEEAWNNHVNRKKLN